MVSFDEKKYLEDVEQFLKEWESTDDGHASERVADRIMDVIHHPEKYVGEG